MTTKDFSDFKNSLDLNFEVDTNMRKITELVKIISAHSRQNPCHLHYVIDTLADTFRYLSEYTQQNIVTDGKDD